MQRQFLRDLVLDVAPALGHAPHRGQQFLGRGILAEVAARAEFHRARGIQRFRVHAQHQDPRRLVLQQHPAQQFQAADARQIEVEQYDIGTIPPQPQQRVAPGRGLGNLVPSART